MMENNNSLVQFHYLVNNFSFTQRGACKSFLETIFKKEKKKLEQLNYIFCSDEYLLEINKNHLDHNYYTDIITFEFNEPGRPVIGEIYISIDRVRDNARNFKEPFNRELHRVIFHGALHLCGHGDKTPAEEQQMRKLEDKYLAAYL